jgi:FMN phosphatase YigB (HAD superfamily)
MSAPCGDCIPTITFDPNQETTSHLLDTLRSSAPPYLIASDIGGVLIKNGICDAVWTEQTMVELANRYGGDADVILDHYNRNYQFPAMGQSSEWDLLRQIASLTTYATADEVASLWFARLEPHFGIELLSQLKQMSWRIVIHSNIDSYWFSRSESRFHFNDLTEVRLLSFQSSTRKPSDEFMQELARLAGEGGGWFLDDNLDNIRTAQRHGWRTIWVCNHPFHLSSNQLQESIQ